MLAPDASPSMYSLCRLHGSASVKFTNVPESTTILVTLETSSFAPQLARNAANAAALRAHAREKRGSGGLSALSVLSPSPRTTFVLAMPPAWLRANVPNVRSDAGAFGARRRGSRGPACG